MRPKSSIRARVSGSQFSDPMVHSLNRDTRNLNDKTVELGDEITLEEITKGRFPLGLMRYGSRNNLRRLIAAR